MTDLLSDLPPEILFLIVKELYPHPLDPCEFRRDLWQWSKTSSFFKHFITPLIIDVMDLRCEAYWGCWLKDAASGPYGHLIKKIRFGVNPDDCHRFEDLSNPAEILPESVGTVLSNLHLLPSLELLSIQFCDNLPEDLHPDTNEESETQVGEAEEREEWRALMACVYRALSHNEKIYAKGLELRDVSFKRVSTFADQSFHNFLSHLQTFSLSLKADDIDCSQGFEANRCPEYVEFTAKLDIFFLDHLSHVTSLTIKTTARGVLGDAGNYQPLALKKNHMPHLKYVDLEYMVVHRELTDFLVGHAATLEHVILRECFVDRGYWCTDQFYWEHLFDALSNTGCSELRRFEILPVFPWFTWPENLSQGDESQILQDPEPGQRLFSYMNLDGATGELLGPAIEDINASLEEGKDQISYDRLMQIANANCHKESCSRTWQVGVR